LNKAKEILEVKPLVFQKKDHILIDHHLLLIVFMKLVDLKKCQNLLVEKLGNHIPQPSRNVGFTIKVLYIFLA